VRPNSVRAILFDLDGTLRHNHPSSDQTFFQIAVELGAFDSPENRRAAMRWAHQYWAQSELLLADLEQYAGSDDEFWENYARRYLLSYACSDDLACSMASEIHRRMKDHHLVDTVLPGVFETLAALRAAGFKLGVVSNRTKPYTEQLARLGLDVYFDCVLAAGDVSAWKPEPEIFFHALQRMGVQAEETIYVGDNYYADVVGAQRAGIRPVLLDPDRIFPAAECAVISEIPELIGLLEK
jgi:putative hydrolase of the HAD superfamily